MPPGWLADPIIQMRLDQLRRAAAAPQCLRVLGLTPPVDRDAVQRRYRELAHAHHPDHGGDPARFVEVQAAYDEALGLVGVGG